MRQLRLLFRIAGYSALWCSIVLACGVITALLGAPWGNGRPFGSEDHGLGMAIVFWGFIGLFLGTLPASLVVLHVVQRIGRRSREQPLRSGESRA
jgi:hypothetical protein